MDKSRILAVVVVAALIGGFFWLQPGQYLGGACEQALFSLDCFKDQRDHIDAFYRANPAGMILGFFAVYVAVTALSIPGAAVMTLAAGAIFGLVVGTVIVSFASSVGATLAFLVARYVLRDSIRQRFGRRLKAIDEGVEKDGAFYLFAMRLVPAFPFFVVNLVMGLTSLKTVTFYLVSQVGMLAGTIVYVNAGTQLAQIDSVGGIVSPGLIASFALLGVFPLLARKLLGFMKSRKVLKGYERPKAFDYNVIVIGAGSAGLVVSLIGATVKARVALIEKDRMGGDCLNTGCVPSKALLRSAKLLSHMRRSSEFGIKTARFEFDFGDVMDRIAAIIRAIEPKDSRERYESLGVDCFEGEARLVDPWTVEVGGRRLTARAIVLATGAAPLVPPIEGLHDVDYLTSENLWSLRELPERLIVLGGGPIGCEMAQAFARFGSQVTQVELAEQLMNQEDPDIAAYVRERLAADGVDIRTGHEAKAVRLDGERKFLVCARAGDAVEIEFDRILVAVGRAARLKGFGLEALGVETGRTIMVNEFLQTNIPTIFACGDAVAPYQFTHSAAHEAWFAAVNGLFGTFKKFKVDYSLIPWCTFVDPEVARVGLSETEAKARDIDYETTTFEIGELDRALAESEVHGVVKVLTARGKDRILGVAIVGDHAGEIIAEFVLAMKHGIGLNKILGTIHIYPTVAEANKFVAGEWKRAHAPQWALDLSGRIHAWRRGQPRNPARRSEVSGS